jgi:hypothetical protein
MIKKINTARKLLDSILNNYKQKHGISLSNSTMVLLIQLPDDKATKRETITGEEHAQGR